MPTTETLATPGELRPGDEVLAVICVDGVCRYARNPAIGTWVRIVTVHPPASYPVVLATFRDGIPAPVTMEMAHADWRGIVRRTPERSTLGEAVRSCSGCGLALVRAPEGHPVHAGTGLVHAGSGRPECAEVRA